MFLSALFSFPVQAKGEMEIGKLLRSGNELPQNTGGGKNKTYKRLFEAESAARDLRRRRHPESPALKAMPGSQRAAKQNILASDVLRYQGEAAIIQENASVSATVGFNVL